MKKKSKAFKKYTRSYKTEIIDSKDPLGQLEASKLSIKDFLKDLLNEFKDFKDQITPKGLLRKHKDNGNLKCAPVYFISTTKTVISSEYDINNSFQEILYRIDIWINERYDWVIKSINSEYISISVSSPLLGSSCIESPDKLRSSMKALINI